MLIKLSDKTLYNTETNTFIRCHVGEHEAKLFFYNGEELHGYEEEHITQIAKSWEILCEVAELQMDALRLRGFDGE